MTNSAVADTRPHAVRTVALLALCLAAVGLAGCETSNSLFGQGSPANQPLASAQPAPQAKRARIAIAPVIGPTSAIATDLAAQMTQQLERERFAVVPSAPAVQQPGAAGAGAGAVVPASDKVDFTLRGYVVATKEKTRTKFSYIWDVMDPAGKRVNRITGEEVGSAVAAGDAWTAATPQIVQSVASRASTSLVAWLPSGATPVGETQAVATAPLLPGQVVPAAARGQQIASAQTTASLPSTKSVIVAKVAGAPGDGSQSLADALQRELGRNGLAIAQGGAASTHRIEGKVILGKATKAPADKGGGDIQPIQIQWTVKDAKGDSLGTVSQKNEIKPGELDGAWGPNADAVAAAAAQGIVKLIDKPTAVN